MTDGFTVLGLNFSAAKIRFFPHFKELFLFFRPEGLSAFNFQLSAFNFPLSTFRFQLSTFRSQLSVARGCTLLHIKQNLSRTAKESKRAGHLNKNK